MEAENPKQIKANSVIKNWIQDHNNDDILKYDYDVESGDIHKAKNHCATLVWGIRVWRMDSTKTWIRMTPVWGYIRTLYSKGRFTTLFPILNLSVDSVLSEIINLPIYVVMRVMKELEMEKIEVPLRLQDYSIEQRK